jgi:hypothetical protein
MRFRNSVDPGTGRAQNLALDAGLLTNASYPSSGIADADAIQDSRRHAPGASSLVILRARLLALRAAEVWVPALQRALTLSKESISCRVSLCHRVHTVSRHHAPQAATRQSDPHIPPDRGADSPWHRGGASEGRRRAAFRAHPGVAAAHQPKYRREGLSRTGARWVGWPWAPLRSLCWPWEPR